MPGPRDCTPGVYTGVVPLTSPPATAPPGPPVLTPRDALRMHADIRRHLADADSDAVNLRSLVAGYFKSLYGWQADRDALAATAARHIDTSCTYHVTPELVGIAVRRAEAFDDAITIDEAGRPPEEVGWCVFGVPLETSASEDPGTELYDLVQRTCAVSWGPCTAVTVAADGGRGKVAGRMLILWANLGYAPDDVHRHALAEPDADKYLDVMRQVGGWTPAHVDFVPHGTRLPRTGYAHTAEHSMIRKTAPDGTRIASATGWLRFIAAVWQLMGETVDHGAAGESRPDGARPPLRWAERVKVAGLTVITLRRSTEAVQHPGTGTPLRWRVPVKRHPRTYHRGTPQEFTITVRAHEKGPQGAPYRRTDKVYTLAR